ncbi:MAG: type II secretion system F family protein [Candidatus Taylorbacteria bacterium]
MTFKTTLQLEDQVEFAKNLSVLLRGGVSIDEAILSLANQARSSGLKKTLTEINGHLAKGVSLYTAMMDSNARFGTVVTSLVRAGELSGSLPENLDFLADWLSRDSNLRKEISSVTLYPKLVIGATVFLGGGLAVFILPKLVPMFSSLHVKLPWITQFILDASVFLQGYWVMILIGLVLITIIFQLLIHTKPVKYTIDRISIHISFFGDMIMDYQLALFSQLLATLLKSGLTVDESLEIAFVGTGNLYYRKALTDMRSRLMNGVSVTETVKLYPALYPPNFVNLLSVGENSGSLQESFTNLADYYTKEISIKTKRLPVVIEPILLVMIGVAVATLALAIILPIYKLTGSLS